MVSSPAPTSTLAPSAASSDLPEPLSPISSILYGSSWSSSIASWSLVTRRSKRWPSLMIFRIAVSIFARSSGTNGVSTSKS